MQDPAVSSYLDLLARNLTRFEMEPALEPIDPLTLQGPARRVWPALQKVLAKKNLAVGRKIHFDAAARQTGRDWPTHAETMVGLDRLANLRTCIEKIIADEVPGDVLETGVWRGGASIYMTAILAAHGDTSRAVWLADSFKGLPIPDTARYGKDEADLSGSPYLAVTADQVRNNFRRYGLLSDNIHFAEGWFSDTMPTMPIDQLSLLRLDGDLYSSTMDVLTPMYDKLSPGGFLIVDDYGALRECERAVTDFRTARGITDEIHRIDWTGVFWRKT